MTLSVTFQHLCNAYGKLNTDEKHFVLNELYNVQSMSLKSIANLCKTYPQKIQRDMKTCGLDRRSASEATANALETGTKEHPTKGKKRDIETVNKISNSMAENWQNMIPTERQRRQKLSKDQWDAKSDIEKQHFILQGQQAVREAAKHGSKLEHLLLDKLIEFGQVVEFHKTHLISNENLHLDIVLTKLGAVIEIDGPSHCKEIWGTARLNKTIQADMQKNGLVLQAGLCMIRIRQSKRLTHKSSRIIWEQLQEVIENIQRKFPEKGNRFFEIGI